jgi:hypothetical protein
MPRSASAPPCAEEGYPGTDRQYRGITNKIKAVMAAAAPSDGGAAQPEVAAAFAAKTALGAKVAPPISTLQMVVEVISGMPDMRVRPLHQLHQ